MSQEDGRPAGEWVPPPQHFAPPARIVESVPAPVAHRAASAGRLRTVVVGLVVTGVLAAAGLAATSGDEERPGPLFVALPSPPVGPSFPAETPATEPTTRTPPLATTRVREEVPQREPTAAGTRIAASPAVAVLVAGQETGFEPVGEPGRRLRHRNFVARIDPVGPASRDLDRADSRFTVRVAAAGCFSFESFNYPGYFLRSRDATLRLERPDRDRGDATFCPVPVAGGGFVLRSGSRLDEYVTERDSVLSLDRVAPAKAKAFVTRPPL
jgi:hypothetical protein